jgi:putative FmdB family regulatory protein
MPTYEYECKTCGFVFEAFQSMSDAPLSSCPECGKAVRRLINGGTGIIFKGSGFYVTDNGGSKTKASASKPSAACPSSGCDSCPKSETSPASKEKAVG